MRNERDPRRGNERNYIPNDEIDREEKADLRQQKKGSMFSVLLGGLIVISLIAFVFVLLDSGILTSGGGQVLYGTPQSSESSGSGELTQEEKKAAEEEARLAQEEAKKKQQEEEEARRPKKS